MVIQSRVSPRDWTYDDDPEKAARCTTFPPPTADEDPWFKDAREAVLICNGDFIGTPCPQRTECLRRAMVNNEGWGVWGGFTTPQRRWIRRNVDKELWGNYEHLLSVVPEPDYFKDWGDDVDDEEDERTEDEN